MRLATVGVANVESIWILNHVLKKTLAHDHSGSAAWLNFAIAYGSQLILQVVMSASIEKSQNQEDRDLSDNIRRAFNEAISLCGGCAEKSLGFGTVGCTDDLQGEQAFCQSSDCSVELCPSRSTGGC